MPIALSFEIEGEKQFSRRLLIGDMGLKNFQVPLQSIGGELKHSFDENFSTRGGLFQGGWPPRVRERSWPLLEKTGRMRQSFRDRVAPDFVVLYNEAPYFKYHQSNQPRARLPRRIMMKIDQQRREFIQKAFQQYIIHIMRKQ